MFKRTNPHRHHATLYPRRLAWGLAAMVLACFITLQAQQKPAVTEAADDGVRLTADLVILNVTVTNSQGEFIHNLTPQHFGIREEGQPQKIEFFGAEQTPFAAVILLDTSGSMADKLSLARAATAQFADNLREDDVLAIYEFADKVKQLQDFTSIRYVAEEVWESKAEGYTRMYDGLVEGIEALSKREERRRAILVISDGVDTRSGHSRDKVLRQALGANVAIYSIDLIGLTGGAPGNLEEIQGRSALKDLAEKTGGRYLRSPGGTQLTESLQRVVEELTNQYTIGYYSTNEKRDGKWRAIQVNLPRTNATLHTRAGYYGPKN